MLYSGELGKDAHSKYIIFCGTVNGVIGYCLFTIFGSDDDDVSLLIVFFIVV